jgi:hypothetical protein
VANDNRFWIYWHFFTIKVNYNSSHTELLLNDVCLTNAQKNLWPISDESLTTEIFWTELTFMQTECRSPSRTVSCPMLFSVHPLLRNVYQSRGNALIYTSVLVATKRAFSEPLSSNGLFRHIIIFTITKSTILCYLSQEFQRTGRKYRHWDEEVCVIFTITACGRKQSLQTVHSKPMLNHSVRTSRYHRLRTRVFGCLATQRFRVT